MSKMVRLRLSSNRNVIGLALKKKLNASKLSEHPPAGGKLSKILGGNVGDKSSSWYEKGSPMWSTVLYCRGEVHCYAVRLH